jgi:hypothetical protein
MLAAEAQRWRLVEQLAAELAARRSARTRSAVLGPEEEHVKQRRSQR